MAWVLQEKRNDKAIEKISVVFYRKYGKDTICVAISICASIAKELGWKEGDMINNFYDSDNHKKWLLKKNDEKNGYKLSKKGRRLDILMSFFGLNLDYSIPTRKIAKFEIINNDLILYIE